jgi:hypothetical protein
LRNIVMMSDVIDLLVFALVEWHPEVIDGKLIEAFDLRNRVDAGKPILHNTAVNCQSDLLSDICERARYFQTPDHDGRRLDQTVASTPDRTMGARTLLHAQSGTAIVHLGMKIRTLEAGMAVQCFLGVFWFYCTAGI